MSFPRSALLSLVVTLVGPLTACQTTDDHPPFAAGCVSNCGQLPAISVNTGHAGSSSSNPDTDAGTGTLQGNVVSLTAESFVGDTRYASGATITADGANGSPVTALWKGAADETYLLEGVSTAAINWISVKPDQVGGDALLTYQAVQAKQVSTVNLGLVSAATLDNIFTAVSTLRSPTSGQVVLFFRSAGTGTPLSGLRVSMPNAQVAIYSVSGRWVLDDGTAFTDSTGLVLFGNVQPANSNGVQAVTVTRAATPTMPAVAAGQFAVKVVEAAVSMATVGVQL